jgi:hypothetical protein
MAEGEFQEREIALGVLRHNQLCLSHVHPMHLQNNFFLATSLQTLARFLFQQYRIRKSGL